MATHRTRTRLTRRTYRQLVYGVIGVGILGLLGGLAVGQELAGTVVYLLGAWIGGGIAFLAPKLTDRPLQDERDFELHNRASGLTLKITTVLGIGSVPALYVLEAGGHLTITDTLWGAIWAISALYLLYGACFGLTKWQA